MNNMINIVKANKEVFIKRGLITAGAIIGMTLIGKMISGIANGNEEAEFDDSETVDEYGIHNEE